MRDLNSFFEKPKDPVNFNAIKISLASPEMIRKWSFGEVKKPETINYRTFKPERDGLFCAKIFGPVKDYECNCGKYKRMKHRGVVCEKCGVEVIQSKVRRDRLGHINLATPVAHIWFLKSLPSRIGNLLDMTFKDLEKVLYFDSYVVTDPKDTPLKQGELLSEEKYRKAVEEYGPDGFEVGMGAEVIKEMLKNLDIEGLAQKLREEMKTTTSETKRKKFAQRLKVVEAFRNSDNEPAWMIMDVIPVIPPDLRPLVPLEGGRFATSDLNDLYRRVINRNNRLKRLQELNAPEIIIRNEKRMLQEAVDALFDNGRRGKTITGANKRPLKSLSDMLKGKQGRFRQNLLGKRVDYSGRSVIVVGPNLRLYQCGLPKKMALELFKPFIYNKLEEKGYVTTIKHAKKQVEKEKPEVWDILDEVIKEHPVLLNRAPTLHRLGIQAFEPVLIEGKAIQLHPLVCQAFNADFDGDQMAVHVPLSVEAQIEARVLMMSTNNILSPAYGKPIVFPSQDIVLGLYYISRERPFVKGTGKRFANLEEVRVAFDAGEVDIQAKIEVRIAGEIVETTVGRVLLYEIVPPELPFEVVNAVMTKKKLAELIDRCFRRCGQKKTVIMADRLRTLGYHYATTAGISICIRDMKIPEKKEILLKEADQELHRFDEERRNAVISKGEYRNKVLDLWSNTSNKITDEMMKALRTEVFVSETGERVEGTSFNSIFMMADSGARGSKEQIRQLAAMRGLMAKPSEEIIETPITSNFREGLSVLHYFISTHGARKGLADTALKTSNSGYLTRRLVDVAQDTIISEFDCGTLDGIEMTALVENGEIVEDLKDRILGRVASEEILHPETEEIIVNAGEEIDEAKALLIEQAGHESVKIRSVLTCQSRRGICVQCYGRDLARGKRVNLGEAVGIIAAQSIGEPGTQLTMRTFHIGGAMTATGEQSSLKARGAGYVRLDNVQTVTNKEGKKIVMNRNGSLTIVTKSGHEREHYKLVYGATLCVSDGDFVQKDALLSEWDPFATPILTEVSGYVKFVDIIEGVTMEEKRDEISSKSSKTIIESTQPDLRPAIEIRDEKGRLVQGRKGPARYFLSARTTITPAGEEGQFVDAGTVIAKRTRDTMKNKDITGGLPRVVELFEARTPKDPAIVTEIDGVVSFGKEMKGKRRIIVTPEIGEAREYAIPKGKHIIVGEDDYVRAGEALTEGSTNPHDILHVRGIKELSKFLVDEIQQVYRRQGVKINDKHIEVIVRKMLQRVKITDVGDTNFLFGQQVEKWKFEEENERVKAAGGKPATGEALLLGITKASLNTESFISASSFQETTKVLTEASIAGKVDHLQGLKENVIMGRLIPAGTGLPLYRNIRIEVAEESDGKPAKEEATASSADS